MRFQPRRFLSAGKHQNTRPVFVSTSSIGCNYTQLTSLCQQIEHAHLDSFLLFFLAAAEMLTSVTSGAANNSALKYLLDSTYWITFPDAIRYMVDNGLVSAGNKKNIPLFLLC